MQMSDNTLVLNYISPYLEEGFTGEVKVTVVYNFSDENELAFMSKPFKFQLFNESWK